MKFEVRVRTGEALSLNTLRRDSFLTGAAGRVLVVLTMILLLSLTAEAATFLVTNTNDTGPGSLRQAITDANAASGNTVKFQIGSGPQTISLASMLPVISRPMIIDGATQPGYAGTPLIEITGNNTVSFGFDVTGGNSTINGLAINSFTSSGIVLTTNSGNTVTNCYLGTSLDGATSKANGAGISIQGGSNGNTIGAVIGKAGNLISGNQTNGIQISGSNGNMIAGNFIGTNAAGTGALGNGSYGLRVFGSNNSIGAGSISSRNVVSGNSRGIGLETTASSNLVASNFIGTTFDGSAALANTEDGIQVFGPNNTIGGTGTFERNVISGNGTNGILVSGSAASGNLIEGNYIGTKASGTAALANGGGIRIIDTPNTKIGGIGGAGNLISGNAGVAVSIEGASSSGTTIQANFIGVDASGTVALANAGGIGISGSNNTIGGSGAGMGNVVSGNTNTGIALFGGSGNNIQGNLIGTNASGTAALANGAGIQVTGSNNVVGGDTPGTRNLVSGNTGIGVAIGGDANKVLSNYIGVAANGFTKLGNASGVSIIGSNHVIGGPVAPNVISGNVNDGIDGQDLTAITIQDNLIGVDSNGSAPVGNGGVGMRLSNTTGSTIGGSSAIFRNIVCANGSGGISIEGASSSDNKILGNYVGTDLTRTIRMGNLFGIAVSGSNNVIGGANSTDGNSVIGNTNSGIGIANATGTRVQGNLISGNDYGVVLENTVDTKIQGNLIGTTASGTTADGNSGFGIYMIDVTGTTIGGTTAAARNVISGNGRSLSIGGTASTGNLVQGNFIGLDITGSVKIANHGSGVELGGVNNTIGGTVPGAGNVISGNDYDGVGMFGSAINNNKIQGNIIGLNAAGTVAIPNGTGVRIIDASNTLIGGTVPGARNIISGNFRGITVDGVGTGTIIQGNYVGTDITGTSALANSWDGIVIGSANNTVGGTVAGARNLISGNANGIRINSAVATGNLIQGNYIGTKANGTDLLPNDLIGVQINTGFNNMIGGTAPGAGNTVAGNNYAGVVIDSGTGNAILGNSIFGNARLGIELSGQDAIGLNENDLGDPDSGANWKQNYPMLTSVVTLGGKTSITGKLNSNPNKQFRIEFFANNTCDGTGFGEGQTFIRSTSVTTDANGDAAINAIFPGTPSGQFITATATSPDNDTSEFSPCALVGGANPGALQFESSFYLAEEVQQLATITVTRTSGMAGAVSVNYATSNGSATSPDDYTPTSGTLNFADGEVIKTFTIPIVYDSLFNETQENVNLTLSNPTGGATLGSQSTSSLFINNNTPTFPGSTFSDASVVEGDNGTTNAVFTITLSPHTDVVTVGYATVDGLATAPADYQATSGQLIFNPGENSKTVSVPVNGDTSKEGNEMFFLNLELQSEGYTLKSQGEGMIIDDDGDASFQFSQPGYSVNEGDGAATITVDRTGDPTKAVTVDYTTADDTATAPSDYTATTGTLSFASGETSKTFTVSINDDAQVEGDEKVSLKLSNATNGATLGSPSTAALTIVDNDTSPPPPPPPSLPGLSITDVSLAEGNNGVTQFAFAVSLSAVSGQPVSVNYATADNSALAGSDYQAASGNLTFAPNEVSKSVIIMVNGDTQVEPDETFAVNLSNPTNATLTKAQGVGTIQNDDAAQQGALAFSTAANSVSENSGQATITVKRVGGSNGAISVQYATVAGGSAAAGSDYTATTGTLNWADGDAKDKTFAIPITNDALDEADEAINLALSNPTGGAALVSPSSAVLTITDDDAAAQVSIDDVSLAEGDSGTKSFIFTVSLSAASGQTVSVNYATADNTAQAASDYQAATGVVSFVPGETSKQVTVLVKGDTQVEPDETFFVNLSNPTNATITKAQGTGRIQNDDAGQAGALAFSTATNSVAENSGQATITVKRIGGSNGAISVQYATVTGGSAAVGSDYTGTAGTLNWADGDAKDQTFTVPIVNDVLDEADETVNLALSNPTGGAALVSPSSAVLTITDDDAAAQVSIDDASLTEGDSGTKAFTFTVSLSAASGQTISVNYATADNTAQAASDYQAATGVVSFAPGETSKPVTVLVNGDTQVEPDETFAVNLSSVVNATIAKGAGAGTIVNDDNATPSPTVQFSQDTYSVPEDLGAMTVTVTRSGDTSGPASVDYLTVDGSAIQKSDYEYAAGALTFAAGETSKTVTILLNEDSLVEGDETFKVTLSNPAGAVLGTQSSTTITIVDDVSEPMLSPVDDAQSFVYLHYHDFLNREPDPAGLQFWTSQITACGTDAKCIDAARVKVSASFFLSIEYQETAYLLYLLQKESYAGTPRYASFMRDLQEVSRGVVVNSPGWQQKLSDNQQQFADKWVNRAEFKAAYDALSNDAFVDALYKNAGLVAPPAERDKLVTALNGTSMNRSAVLLEVAGDARFRQQEQNAAFVLMEYFGYLRRDPDASPDSDLSGYNFWLNKLNQFNGNYLDAEMVRAFIVSSEYRQRFGF